MFRLVCRRLVAPRVLAPILRLSRAPLLEAPIIHPLQTWRFQRYQADSVYEKLPQSTQNKDREFTERRGQASRWGTSKESVMAVFESLLPQQTSGEKPSQVLFEVMKNCANPTLLETPATKAVMATEMLSKLKERGFLLDVSLYNTLLRTYNLLHHPFTPSHILSDMQSNGVEPNLATFSYLIEGYCLQGNISGATKLLEHMNANNFAINEHVYASLISGHAYNGDMTQAEGVLELSRTKGYTPGSVAYSALLCAYAQQGDLDGMLKVRDQMKKERVFISNTFLVKRVIDTLSLHGHNHLIPSILDLIKSKVWVLEDLRQLACTLFLRGEIEGGLIIVHCLELYSAVPTVIGQAAVRGMVLAQQPLHKILDIISQFSEMSSRNTRVKDWMLYRDLLGLLFSNQLSTGDQRASDIVSVITAMKDTSPVDNSYLYPVLAHHAERGNIEGCLDTLDLMSSVSKNKFDFYAGVFVMRTLDNAKLSPSVFFSNNPRSSIALNTVLLFLSDTGQLRNLAQVLSTCSSSEEVAVGHILTRISVTFKYAYRLGFLRELADVYKALHALEPRPSLERSVAIIVNSFSGKRANHTLLYKELLTPLIQAGVPVGQGVSDLLFNLYQKRSLSEFKKVYNEVKDKEGIVLSPTVQRVATMQATLSGMSQVLDTSQKLLLYSKLKAGENEGSGEHPSSSPREWEQEVIRFIELSDIETALKIREDMLQHGHKLRFGVYSKFLEHYARQGDVKNMLSEFEAIKEAGLTPNISVYLNLMLCYSVQGEPEEVLRAMEEAVQNGWQLSSATTGHLLMAYLNKNCVTEALQVVQDYTGNTAPNGFYLKVLLNEVVKQGRPQEEVEVVLQALRQRPTLSTMDLADIEQTVYLNNERMDKAKEVMERKGYQVKRSNLLSTCRRWKSEGRAELVLQVAELLREAGVHRKSTNNAVAVLSLYNLLKDKEGAQSLHQDLIDNGHKVDQTFLDIFETGEVKTPRRRHKKLKTTTKES